MLYTTIQSTVYSYIDSSDGGKGIDRLYINDSMIYKVKYESVIVVL